MARFSFSPTTLPIYQPVFIICGGLELVPEEVQPLGQILLLPSHGLQLALQLSAVPITTQIFGVGRVLTKCVSFFSVPATMPDETSPGCIPVPFLNKVKIVNNSVAGPVGAGTFGLEPVGKSGSDSTSDETEENLNDFPFVRSNIG